ncbi:hypothetical protein ACMD2_26581 [Ananas comosus]|uniref:Uncharacterized protein n=1 Tax=Ananas comosus TaxID=4615 RepID=A0A199VFT4_ANACO|nr:hypothetical protein ACMD2_26581 [Ananas comosus]
MDLLDAADALPQDDDSDTSTPANSGLPQSKDECSDDDDTTDSNEDGGDFIPPTQQESGGGRGVIFTEEQNFTHATRDANHGSRPRQTSGVVYDRRKDRRSSQQDYGEMREESSECRQVERQVFSLFRGVIDSVWKGSSNRYCSRISCGCRRKYRRRRNNQRASAQNPDVEMAIANESNSLGPTNSSASQWRKTRKRRSSGTDDSINESFNATLRSIQSMFGNASKSISKLAGCFQFMATDAIRKEKLFEELLKVEGLVNKDRMPVVQPSEELLLLRVEGDVQPLEQLGGVLIVHEEPVVEIEAVAAGVLHQLEQHLVPLSVDGGGLEIQFGEHAADGVGEELDLGGALVVLAAGHLDHPAALAGEDVEEVSTAVEAVVGVGEADLVVDEGEAGPAVLGGLGAEHGVGAEDVEVRGEELEEEVLGELLDGEDVDEEGAAAEALEGEGA